MIEFQNRHVKLPDGSPVVVCRIKGSIDGATLQQFEDKLLGFLDQGVKHLIIVFSQVRYINSTGMGVLVKLADKFQEVGGDFNLVDVPDKMVALFNMLGLLALIKLSKNEEEALKSFQQRKSNAQAQLQSASANKTVPPPVPPVPPASPKRTTASLSKDMLTSTAKTTASIPMMTPGSQQKSPGVTQKNVTTTSASTTKSTVPISTGNTVKMAAGTGTATATSVKPKVYIITCKKCNSKVSLGTQVKPGSYRCPKCMAIFKVTPNGQIEFT